MKKIILKFLKLHDTFLVPKKIKEQQLIIPIQKERVSFFLQKWDD